MIDWVSRGFDRSVSRLINDADTVYGYEDSCLETLFAAKESGKKTVYELPTAFVAEAQALSQSELKSEPSLKPFLRSLDEPEYRIRRKIQEIQTADQIVCASTFVARSIRKHVPSANSIEVIPYGADCSASPKNWDTYNPSDRLKILFLGQLSPHKGLHHLFGALETLPKEECELTLAGEWSPGFSDWISARFRVSYTYRGKVPHVQIPSLCAEHHLLVFPAIQDGFGLVLLEALASGIPVLASYNCGASDVVCDGDNGYLFHPLNPEGLRTGILRALQERERLPDMGFRARTTAEGMTWARYRSQVASLLCCASSFLPLQRGRSD